MKVGDWLDERTGHRGAIARDAARIVPGGASVMFVFGALLGFLLLLQLVTGILLAFVYSPSTSAAWASVAYLEDQTTWGWLVRGIHHHGASAVVIVTGLHLLQTAVFGAYKRPREMTWLVGVLLLGLVMAFALTGYLLPWDQTGYAATQVATGIAASTPVVGGALREAIQGGNDYGNLTLTRFFALHVLVLPVLTAVLVVVHVVLARRHGLTPRWGQTPERLLARAQPYWPEQRFRNVVAMAIAFAALMVVTVQTGGAPLDAPADPSATFDARPAWYFRPLFQALKYVTGSAEIAVALGTPAIVGGFLLLLPFVDRGDERSPRRRVVPLALLALGVVGIGVLLAVSYADDAADERYAESVVAAEKEATHARSLARTYGVPPAGGPAVYLTRPHQRVRFLWHEHCAGCHEGDERKAPLLEAGYNGRAWIRAFLENPSDDRFFGRTKLAGDAGMPKVEKTGAELDALVELVYAQTGAGDVDAAKVEASKPLFEEVCSDCHNLERWTPAEAAPTIIGRGSRRWFEALLVEPSSPHHYGSFNEMPSFDELAPEDLRVLAEHLVWLRSARAEELAARLGPDIVHDGSSR